MNEESVTFGSGQQTLVGTLCTPASAPSGPVPAVVLLSGSGPLDRDGNHRRMRLDISRQLAHALAGAGVASLRYDKRGVGDSPGDWRAAGLWDNVDDAEAAVRWLAEQPGVRRDAVFVVGHSEGAVLATAVAARWADLAGLVLLSGSGRSGEQVLLWQAERVLPTLPGPVRALLKLMRSDAVGKVAANHAKLKATTEDVVRLNGARVNARWFREFMAHDPAEDLARITAPVLAITGSNDLQVSPADLESIAGAAAGPVTTHLVPQLTHTLRVQERSPSLSRYREEVRRPVDPQVLALVTSWVGEHVPGAAG